MADITYCTSVCPFEDCERHGSRIKDLQQYGVKYVSLADFAPVCRRYIRNVVEEVTGNGST